MILNLFMNNEMLCSNYSPLSKLLIKHKSITKITLYYSICELLLVLEKRYCGRITFLRGCYEFQGVQNANPLRFKVYITLVIPSIKLQLYNQQQICPTNHFSQYQKYWKMFKDQYFNEIGLLLFDRILQILDLNG